MDLVSVLPFDLIVVITDYNSQDVASLKFIKFIRLLRLVKLLRVLRVTRIIARWQARSGVKFATLALGKYAVMVAILAHWAACLFAITARMTEGEVTWLDQYLGASPSTFSQYISAFYWSTMTVTTIGYGDVTPQTDQERIMACICMFTGCSVYAVIIGSICGLVTQMDQAGNEFQASMDHLNVYMEEVRLPHGLRVDLRRYFQNSRKIYKHKFNQRVMTQMSPGLRKTFCLYVHQKWINSIKFFNHPDEPENESFCAAIALVMEMEAFPPSEVCRITAEFICHIWIAFAEIFFHEFICVGAPFAASCHETTIKQPHKSCFHLFSLYLSLPLRMQGSRTHTSFFRMNSRQWLSRGSKPTNYTYWSKELWRKTPE